MTAAAPPRTEPRHLDEALARLRDGAPRWARAGLPERIALARSMQHGAERTAARAVAAACEAKGLPEDGPLAGEEWVSGPYVTARFLRLLVRSLSMLARNGNTPVGALGQTADGRLSVRVFPAGPVDALLFPGTQAAVHLLEGIDEQALHASRARFHKAPDHDGRVCLVLGAGNINSIPPLDVATKLFVEGKACLLKLNPINAYLGPVLEEAFAEAISRGVLAIAQGGAEEGSYLAHHPAVDEVHVTGSIRTHDALVWGTGADREARRAGGAPVLGKAITSELGGVTPVLVVPGPWDAATLRAQAESVAGMVTYNAGFNCVSARSLVTPAGWRHRDAFLAGVEHFMALSPPRRPWYPGSAERAAAAAAGREQVRRVGQAPGRLPWTLVTGLDPGREDPAFAEEAFCPVLTETAVGSEDPVEFLDRAAAFANERLQGTLAAHLVVHPATLSDPALRPHVERAIRRLRYGMVSVNCWAATSFVMGTTPWGAFPGATLDDARSGIGFVHNALMLEGVEKAVVRQPARPFPKPVYFPTHRTGHLVGRGLVRLEARGRLRHLPGVVLAGLRG